MLKLPLFSKLWHFSQFDVDSNHPECGIVEDRSNNERRTGKPNSYFISTNEMRRDKQQYYITLTKNIVNNPRIVLNTTTPTNKLYLLNKPTHSNLITVSYSVTVLYFLPYGSLHRSSIEPYLEHSTCLHRISMVNGSFTTFMIQ